MNGVTHRSQCCSCFLGELISVSDVLTQILIPVITSYLTGQDRPSTLVFSQEQDLKPGVMGEHPLWPTILY